MPQRQFAIDASIPRFDSSHEYHQIISESQSLQGAIDM